MPLTTEYQHEQRVPRGSPIVNRHDTDRRMGYAITIRRDPPISYDEWLVVARADPDLSGGELDEERDGPHQTRRVEVFFWDRPGAPDDEGMAAFRFRREGCIEIDHVFDDWTAKIAAVALRLNARAIGDDGEVYDIDGSSRNEHDVAPPARPWWRRILGD